MSLGTRPGADLDSAALGGRDASSGLDVSCAFAAVNQIAGAPSDTANSNVSRACRETRIVASRYQPNLASRREGCNKRYLFYFDGKTRF